MAGKSIQPLDGHILAMGNDFHPIFVAGGAGGSFHQLEVLGVFVGGDEENIAVVFDKLPKKWHGYKVIDGDLSDLRHLDPKGVIIGLKYKKLTGSGANNNKAFENGFAVRLVA